MKQNPARMKTSHQSIIFGIKGRAAGSKVQYVQESSRHNHCFSIHSSFHIHASAPAASQNPANNSQIYAFVFPSSNKKMKKGPRCSRAAEMTCFHPKRQP
jgi:hypothetical protein